MAVCDDADKAFVAHHPAQAQREESFFQESRNHGIHPHADIALPAILCEIGDLVLDLFVEQRRGSHRTGTVAGRTDLTHIDLRLGEIDERIAELEREKYPLYRREMENDRNISALRRMRIKRQWWRLEGSREFDARVDALREKKAGLRRTYRYRAGVIREEIERIAGLQEAERRKQKKLEKSYEDFMKLLTFVETVEDDDFWRSEVVQITAKTTPSGALEVELTPRSGRFAVLFGRLEDVERKFDKLLRFYRSGLSSIGWSEYRTIDIRYNDQVVCKK